MTKKVSDTIVFLLIPLVAATIIALLRDVAKHSPVGFELIVVGVEAFALFLILKKIGGIKVKPQPEAKKQEKASAYERIIDPTPEVEAFRKMVAPDVQTCLAGTDYRYIWVSALSATDIIVLRAGAAKNGMRGELLLSDDGTRVENVRVLENGAWHVYRNIPYYAMLVKQAQGNGAEQPTKDTPDKPEKPAQAAADKPSEPVDKPNIPDNVLEQSAGLVWDDISVKISSLIDMAINDGLAVLGFEWPEGIQSEYEAKLLASKITDALGLTATVDAQGQRIEIALPEEAAPATPESIGVVEEDTVEQNDYSSSSGQSGEEPPPEASEDDVEYVYDE